MDHNAAAMLRAAADYIETHDLGDKVLGVDFNRHCGPSFAPGMTLHIRPAAWSLLATGRAIIWNAERDSAFGAFRVDGSPWLNVRALWTRNELTAAAPDVAAAVLLPTVRHSAAVWPGQEVTR